MTGDTGRLPRQKMTQLEISILDWEGPIVEIAFLRPVEDRFDVDRVLLEANGFMQTHVRPHGGGAYFVTCYDGLAVSREVLLEVQGRFKEFNETYSLGDVRYGGSEVAQMLVISTAVLSARPSNLYSNREEALSALREHIRRDQATGTASC